MNNYNNTVYLIFRSPQNYERLSNHIAKLLKLQTSPISDVRESVLHFAEIIPQELLLSDPLPGTTVTDQVNGYNQRFISYFINNPPISSRSRISNPPTDPVAYAVSDTRINFLPRISERDKRECPQTADNMLNAWKNNPPARPHALGDRDDDIGYMSRFESPMIDYTDYSSYGFNNHLDAFNTDYMEKLNNMREPHQTDIIGSGSAAIDDSLSHRRIFRSEGGVENAIPKRYTTLHKRNYDTDITGNLQQNTEMDCMLQKFDNSRIKCKIDRNRQLRNMYDGEIPQRKKYDSLNNQQLYPINLRIPK